MGNFNAQLARKILALRKWADGSFFSAQMRNYEFGLAQKRSVHEQQFYALG